MDRQSFTLPHASGALKLSASSLSKSPPRLGEIGTVLALRGRCLFDGDCPQRRLRSTRMRLGEMPVGSGCLRSAESARWKFSPWSPLCLVPGRGRAPFELKGSSSTLFLFASFLKEKWGVDANLFCITARLGRESVLYLWTLPVLLRRWKCMLKKNNDGDMPLDVALRWHGLGSEVAEAFADASRRAQEVRFFFVVVGVAGCLCMHYCCWTAFARFRPAFFIGQYVGRCLQLYGRGERGQARPFILPLRVRREHRILLSSRQTFCRRSRVSASVESSRGERRGRV